MKRFIHLIQKNLESDIPLREIERKTGVTATSLSNYLNLGTEPRQAQLVKLAGYFGESVASLLMEVGANNYDERILVELPKLTDGQKEKLLRLIEDMRR